MKLKINADIRECNNEEVVSAIRGLPKKEQIKEVIVRTEEVETAEEKPIWNLADTYEKGCVPKFFEPKDIKTFIQKVKEDIKKVQLHYVKGIDVMIPKEECLKILYKRAGKL